MFARFFMIWVGLHWWLCIWRSRHFFQTLQTGSKYLLLCPWTDRTASGIGLAKLESDYVPAPGAALGSMVSGYVAKAWMGVVFPGFLHGQHCLHIVVEWVWIWVKRLLHNPYSDLQFALLLPGLPTGCASFWISGHKGLPRPWWCMVGATSWSWFWVHSSVWS